MSHVYLMTFMFREQWTFDCLVHFQFIICYWLLMNHLNG